MSTSLVDASHIEKSEWVARGAIGEDGQQNQRATSEAGNWDEAIETLVRFRRLGNNWDGLNSRAPSDALIASAIGLACLLHERGSEPPTRVVPGPEATVIFEWQESDGTYCEVEVIRPLFAEVMLIEPGKPAQHWVIPNADA